MPTYEYACSACEHQWEEVQKISEAPLDTCPKCSQKTAKRQISGGNFILKGGGWYADLYSSSSNKKSSGETKTESKSESSGSSSNGSSNGSSGSSKTESSSSSSSSSSSTTPAASKS